MDNISTDEIDLKRDYWNWIVGMAPDLIKSNGGRMLKADFRAYWEKKYPGDLPSDLSNSYKHAFKIMYNEGITTSSQGSNYYTLKTY